ncbi:MAG: hypothetical protein AAGG50_08305 [Bacteroidota bacterium]
MRLTAPLLVLLLLAAGCRDEVAPPPPDDRAEALPLLDRLDRTALDSTFAALARRPYVLTTVTAQLDSLGAVLGQRTEVLRIAPGAAPEVVRVDSVGAFEFGGFARFAEADAVVARLASPLGRILPDEPSYLTPRGQESYAYALRDTTVAGQRLTLVDVAVRPGFDDRRLRRVRFAVDNEARADEDSGALIRTAHLVRTDRSVLFDADLTLDFALAPDSTGAWLPSTVTFTNRIDAPGTEARWFRVTRTYEPLSNGGRESEASGSGR